MLSCVLELLMLVLVLSVCHREGVVASRDESRVRA
jgi:hypothetical protein